MSDTRVGSSLEFTVGLTGRVRVPYLIDLVGLGAGLQPADANSAMAMLNERTIQKRY